MLRYSGAKWTRTLQQMPIVSGRRYDALVPYFQNAT